MSEIDRAWLRELMARELTSFREANPRSSEIFERARGSLLDGVPMNWMVRWPGEFPVYVDEAHGARFTDVDGHEYVDLCLGDTGAMAGHSPEPVVRTVAERSAAGITTMLPNEDAGWVGEELGRRFGLPLWQFSLTATDANRWAIRLARQITGRPKVLVQNWCYHGSVDETFIQLAEDGKTVLAREGNIGPPVDPAVTTRVVEINDVEGLERELAHGDVACALVEPALTNIGIVLPDDGYHDALRRLTREHGTLLIIDETHTICAGPGGYTKAHGLEPDMLTIGKPIAGGIPIGTYGFTHEVAEGMSNTIEEELSDVGGVGGTLAGNALSLAAARACLGEVMTDEAFERMIAPRRALHRGRAVGDRRARRALARDPARLPRRVPVQSRRRPRRCPGGGIGRRRARPLHAPARAQPRHPADALPQHVADEPGDDRGGRGPPHRGLQRRRRRAGRGTRLNRAAERVGFEPTRQV